MLQKSEVLFEVTTPIELRVRTTTSYWELITTGKHPVMANKLDLVINTLQEPDEIRKSKSDPAAYLFYKTYRSNRWITAVVKRLNGEGFLMTAYIADTIKEGEEIWKR